MSNEREAEPLAALRRLRALHGFRAETLVPDLAFVGLVDDTLEAAEEALQLSVGPRPHRAYAMVRVAFEAAQRLLVLATAENYVNLGTRAWLYYVGKDESLRDQDNAGSATGDYRDQIIKLWALRFPEAEAVVEAERANLQKRRGPDNFLGTDMADAVGAAYEVLAKSAGKDPPPSVVKSTRDAYRALCRESHACLRLEPRGLKIDSDGFVEIVQRERKIDDIQQGVASGLTSALIEAMMAVRFRIASRNESDLDAIRETASEHPGGTREDFRRDFGLYLIERGLAGAMQMFIGAKLPVIGVLPDGTVSSSTTISVDDEVFMATFDFKGECAERLFQQLRDAYPELDLPSRETGEHQILHLPKPHTATIAASVGYFRYNEEDKFVPLVVTELL